MSLKGNWTVPANERYVRFFGRTASEILPDGVFFNWSCSGFSFQFYGTAVRAELSTDLRDDNAVARQEDRAWLTVFVDDYLFPISRFELSKPRQWYTLAEGLPPGKHTIRVIKETEVGYGRSAVHHLQGIGEGVPEPDRAYSRRIQVIGDSITCGYGNLCFHPSDEFVTSEECGSLSYASLLAKRLHAELQCVCASGNGIYHDYGCQTHNLLPELYRYTDKMLWEHYGKVPELWDAGRYKPDIIFIKAGQNDAQFCLGMDLADTERSEAELEKRRKGFQLQLERFLSQIEDTHPNTPVLYILESGMVLNAAIQAVLNRYKQTRPQAKLYAVEVASKQPGEGAGANGHWSACTHSRVAMELEPVVRTLLNWAEE